MKKTLYYNISKLYTMAQGVKTADKLADCAVLSDGWLLVKDGLITDIGSCSTKQNLIKQNEDTELVDLQGSIVIPGLIDAHSHLVHAGQRSQEYPSKIKGKSYLDILKAGGGILSTVEATRTASKDTLYNKAEISLQKALSKGVTTMEIKSGYGLDLKTEVKQLEVAKELNESQAIELVTTYMGAHALPQEFSNNTEYLDFCSKQVFPLVKDLAEFCDIFLDEGVFLYQEADVYLKSAQDYGFKIKMHIDEIANLNGSELAVKYQANSVEHCMVTTKEQLATLASAKIPIVLLPVTSFNLNKAYSDVAVMKQVGNIIALGSDYNPGSCPCDDYLLTMRIASRAYGLLAEEVLTMATINAAKAIAKNEVIGSLEKGKQADFVVINSKDFNEVIARLDSEPVTKVIIKGKQVYSC